MRKVAFDTETALILDGLQAPPLACLSWAERVNGKIESGVISRQDAPAWFNKKVTDPDVQLIGHNVAYDTVVMANTDNDVLPALFDKYENSLVHDTMLREQLIDLAKGKLGYRPRGHYSLANLAKTYAGMELDKTDGSARLHYGKLIRVDFKDWSPEAIKYAEEDAVAALRVFEAQGTVADGEAQARAGFVFHLMQTWGMRTDPERVAKLKGTLLQSYMELLTELQGYKIIRDSGSKDMALVKQLVEDAYPGGVPLTPTGDIKTSREVMMRCENKQLETLIEYKKVEKLLKTFIVVAEKGIKQPLCPQINTLVKNGRSSYRKPNLQNLPREGGIRECFIPRPGKVFVDVDYDTLEIRTLAEALWHRVGGTTLIDEYAEDPDFDPHTRLAAQIMGISYKEGIRLKVAKDKHFKDMRQMCKAAGFGYPGGMGAKTFIPYAKSNYGVTIDLLQAKKLKKDWERSIPEMALYFKQIAAKSRGDRAGKFEQLFSKRKRGGMYYTDMANGWWSGLAADGAKHALFNISKACYVEKDSPLYGSRPVVYIHDEYMLEVEEEKAHEVGMELARIAMRSMEVFTPHVPSRASPCIMRRWYKGAEPVYDENGRLIPWEPS